MMTSLLSIFDPGSNVVLSNWVILFSLVFFPVSKLFWKTFSLIQSMYTMFVKLIQSMFDSKESLVYSSLFMFLFLINLMGLIPYGFSLSSHFSFNFCMGFFLWISTMIWGFSKNLNANISHLTPMGCPLILVPFMVLVETISMIIRPVTLSLRLMSNMMAGHMIISLISGAVFSMLWLVKPMFLFLNIFFFMFELGVAMIQTYVFTMLMMLYWKDTE
uniref:ATP synthase subunit a n=1 Tax=Colpocephalum griffoneae TaxID=2358484 RepID=A0A386B2M3_9NEOP|nr:ATP synthase F0 subunit 6 [Colpocephalum griffoneae]AYC65899.1 ATP synthase F0 subunit 6 [Colpocephalum griffoneae]